MTPPFVADRTSYLDAPQGGTESQSFNRLEEIALGWAPQTPVCDRNKLICTVLTSELDEKVGPVFSPLNDVQGAIQSRSHPGVTPQGDHGEVVLIG